MALDKKSFEKVWSTFTEKFSKSMIAASKEEKPTIDVANKILDRTMVIWSNEKEDAGRWMILYCDKYPRSGRKICDVLENLTIKHYEEPKGINKNVRRFLPLCLSVIVFFIMFFITSWVWAAVLAVVMLAISGSVVYAVNESIKATRDKDIIKGYVEELDRSKEKILNIIE
ncbi:MAG: hypothetical protein IJ316_01115 [Clostridia bacterium]|nr:hypothetical protein [Clostridia bacterium]